VYISLASTTATFTSLFLLASASKIGRAELEPRDNVAVCKAVLVALKASVFCSSFVPIKDVTVTVTKTGTAGSTQVTVTAPCTYLQNVKRQASTTPAAPKTTPAAPLQCSIKGVHPQLASFGCSVIKQACTLYTSSLRLYRQVSPVVQIQDLTPAMVLLIVRTNVPGSILTDTTRVTPTCPPTTTTTTTTTTTSPPPAATKGVLCDPAAAGSGFPGDAGCNAVCYCDRDMDGGA
jgi:hypothetical protein